jgi:hypothetical protein
MPTKCCSGTGTCDKTRTRDLEAATASLKPLAAEGTYLLAAAR